ncbi:MAG: alpha/beta hydrolase [Planctomycetota bacterium]
MIDTCDLEAVVFGPSSNLLGVVTNPTKPLDETVSSTGMGVIFVTAGMLTSCGPYRLHQRLADKLAHQGVPSMRFDLSGIGESLAVGGGGSSIDRAAAEISEAVSELTTRTACDNVILFGLCSGADDAVQAALSDERIGGLVLMDGCGYPTRRFRRQRWLRHYGYRVLQPVVWRRQMRRWMGRTSDEVVSMPMGTDVREFPDRETAAAQFQELVDKGVRMHFIYTGGVAEYYNHADQFWDMFSDVDWRQCATTTFFSKMDHVAMLAADRQELESDVIHAIQEMTSR